MEIQRVNDDPSNPIRLHWESLHKLYARSEEGERELREFLSLIEDKLECELQKVKILH